MLPDLKKFLKEQFPGLHIVTKQCTSKDLERMKKEQFVRKRKEGKNLQLIQNSDDDISSSDESELDRRNAQRKSKKQLAYEALEDPKKAAGDLIPGDKG